MKRIISIVILSTFLFNTAAADLALSQPMAPARGLDNLSTPSIFNPITGTPMAKDINFISGIVIEHLLPVMKYAAGQPITKESISDILNRLDANKLLAQSSFAPIQLFGHEVGTVTVDGKEMLHLMCRINQGGRKETYHAVFSPTATNIDELTLSVFRDDEFLKLFPDMPRARALKSLPARGQDDLDAIERDRLHQIYDREVLDVVYADDSIPKYSFEELGLNFPNTVRGILSYANVVVDREHSPSNIKNIEDRECTIVAITPRVRELLETHKVWVKPENGEPQLVTAYAHSSNNSITLFIEPYLIRFLQSESESNRLVALHAINLLLAHEIGVSLGYQAIGFLNGAVSSLELCSGFDVRCANYNLYGKKSEPQTRPLVDLDTNPLTRDYAMGKGNKTDARGREKEAQESGGSPVDLLIMMGRDPGRFIYPEYFSEIDHRDAMYKTFKKRTVNDTTLWQVRKALCDAGYLITISESDYRGQYNVTPRGLDAIGYLLAHHKAEDRDAQLKAFETAARWLNPKYNPKNRQALNYALVINTGSSAFEFDVPLATTWQAVKNAGATAVDANFEKPADLGVCKAAPVRTTAYTVCVYEDGEYPHTLAIFNNDTKGLITWSDAVFHSDKKFKVKLVKDRYLVFSGHWERFRGKREGVRTAIFDLVERKRIDDPDYYDMQTSAEVRKNLYIMRWKTLVPNRHVVRVCDLQSGAMKDVQYQERPIVSYRDPFVIFSLPSDDGFSCFNTKTKEYKVGTQGDSLWKSLYPKTPDTGDSLTIDGKELTPAQMSDVKDAIAKAYGADVPAEARAESKKMVKVNGNTGYVSTSNEDVELVVIPGLAACDYIIGHAGRGGVAMNHKKRRIYFSPEKYKWYKELETKWPAAAKQFINHEIGHIDVKNALQGKRRKLSEDEVQLLYPVNLVLAAQELEALSVEDAKRIVAQRMLEELAKNGVNVGCVEVKQDFSLRTYIKLSGSIPYPQKERYSNENDSFEYCLKISSEGKIDYEVAKGTDGRAFEMVTIDLRTYKNKRRNYSEQIEEGKELGAVIRSINWKKERDDLSSIYDDCISLFNVEPIAVQKAKRQALRDKVFGRAEDAPAATTTTAADEGADDLLALATNAGLAIETDIGKRSTLLIDSAFYGSSAEEMESDQAVFGDRAYLNMVSGNTIENYIANIISKAQSDAQSDKIEDRDRSPERTIVLINRDRFVNEADQRAAFERLAKEAPGIKVLFTTKQALADMRASAEREALKKGTYCMMLAARQITSETPADSPLIRGLAVFLKAYAGLTDTATIGRAIDAMRAGLSAGQFWNTITGVINVTLSYRPSEPEAQKDATLFAEPMIRA